MSAAEPIISSRQTHKEINGITTQVVCTEFSNYIFIVITQYGKIGTLVSVTPESRCDDFSNPMFSTKVLLGKDEVCGMNWFEKVKCVSVQFCICTCVLFSAPDTRVWQKPGNICVPRSRQQAHLTGTGTQGLLSRCN